MVTEGLLKVIKGYIEGYEWLYMVTEGYKGHIGLLCVNYLSEIRLVAGIGVCVCVCVRARA